MDADKLKGQLDMIVLAALVAGSARGFGVREIKRVLRVWPFAASVRRSQPPSGPAAIKRSVFYVVVSKTEKAMAVRRIIARIRRTSRAAAAISMISDRIGTKAAAHHSISNRRMPVRTASTVTDTINPAAAAPQRTMQWFSSLLYVTSSRIGARRVLIYTQPISAMLIAAKKP